MQSLDRLKEFIDCDWFLKNKVNINSYYKINALAYRKIHSKEGFMHMEISTNNKDMSGILYQPKTVETYIDNNTSNILELGSGQGANLAYLANKYKNIQFVGIDLYPKVPKDLNNVDIIKTDYRNLIMIPDASQDIVYAFETLCYAKDKKRIFAEVERVLKKGGKFIIFDGYSDTLDSKLTHEEKEIKKLVQAGMAVDNFEYYENIEEYAKKTRFDVTLVKDLSENVLPNMHRFKRIIDRYMDKGLIFKIVCKILPKAFVGNAISGYLMEESVRANIFGYYEHIFTKK